MGSDSRALQRASIVVDLTKDDVDLLIALAPYYERSMGPFRSLVRLTARGDVRTRFNFVREESRLLARWAEEASAQLQESQAETLPITLTPRTLIAFWGRVLASLNTPRSRRKLRLEAIAQRESLAAKLETAARKLPPKRRESEMATRRPIEVGWMRERLEL